MIDVSAVRTEADVEIKIISDLLRLEGYLGIPTVSIKAKEYLKATALDKVSGKSSGYYPDFSVWIHALPVLIIEAKAPEVDASIGYREASLYARHLNQEYPSDVNPCRYILACNGLRLLAGTWDATPLIDLSVADLDLGSSETSTLREYLHFPILKAHAETLLARVRIKRFTVPVAQIGGQSLLNSKKPPNSFAAEISPLLRRYFTSTSQNNDPEIFERAYVATGEITSYDRVLESFLKDRMVSRRGSLGKAIEPTKSQEPRLTSALDLYAESRPQEGQLQLITGRVGTGKSLFARRYKEKLQTADQREKTHWAFIDFNSAPPELLNSEEWLCESFVESFTRENQNFDPYSDENQMRIFSRDIQKRSAVYSRLRKASAAEEERQRAIDFVSWQDDSNKTAFGICEYFIVNRRETIVVVMDNVDRMGLQEQLRAFQLSLWFMEKTRAFIILQMRDETYERYKNQPPLDTFRTGIVFHITPPRFIDVVKRRLELCLGYLAENADDFLEFHVESGMRIRYPKSMVGEFLRGVYLELFEQRKNVSRILQGIAGSDVRRALDMFVSILISGHLSEDTIASQAKGAGQFGLPEYTVLKILMRTEYRFFNGQSGFVENVFHVDQEWVQPNNFLIVEVLYWLLTNRKRKGSLGLEGYFSIERLADEMQLFGFVREDVASACTWLLRTQLVEADHMGEQRLAYTDCIRSSASGFIHLRILTERIEYLYGVLPITAIGEESVCKQISRFLNSENSRGRLNVSEMVRCVKEFQRYLRYQCERLTNSYPGFGGDGTGARFVLQQIEQAIRHIEDPRQRKALFPNLLDDI